MNEATHRAIAADPSGGTGERIPNPQRKVAPGRLLQELQLHQIELTAQNEELEQARAETQAALEHYTDFYDAAPVGFLTLEREGKVRQVNATLAGWLGGERNRLENQDFGKFIEAADQSAFRAFLERIFAQGTRGFCEVALAIPGQPASAIFVHIDATLGRTGQACSAVVVDITERKQAELLLRGHRDRLEAAVAERTAELVAANKELEGFTYAVSHDLKGPLSRINSFGHLLERQYGDRLEGDGLQFLGFIRQNITRLTQQVDELLSHARAAQQTLHLQAVDVRVLVQATLGERTEDIRASGAEVSFRLEPVPILGDPHLLRQVLVNLLENALKYSAPDARPRIEIGGEIVGKRFRLWVQDHGIGFDMAYHDEIFEIFRRLHAYSEYAGTGVGLALVKRAMERMGGRVWAESELGQGTTFFLELPLAPAA